MKYKYFSLTIAFFLFFACEPFITEFEELENAVMYESSNFTEPEDISSPKVMTWNIRFGAGRIPWTYDSCGDRVLLTDDELMTNLNALVSFIEQENPDILLLQEVDVLSKRSSYLDQVQWLLDNTNMNYGAYASMWQAQFIPNDGLGRIDQGNVVLSKWPIEEAQRIQLALRTDQSSFVQYFYLRRNILKTKINVPFTSNPFYAIVTHTTAFATDDTKQKHINKYLETLENIQNNGDYFVAGGDLNSVPPGSVTDFCESDKCDGVECDEDYENNEAYQGSYFEHFEGEPDILVPLYNSFNSAIDFADANLPSHFTHAPSTSYERNDIKYDRKLDYLFTNKNWVEGTTRTHQNAWQISDHTPVSGVVILGE